MSVILFQNTRPLNEENLWVNTRQREARIVAENGIYQGGITIIVAYEDEQGKVSYSKLCDGITAFNDLPILGGGGGSGDVSTVNGKAPVNGDVQITASDVGAATIEQGELADTALQTLVAGDNITIDNTDPQNPVITSTGGGGGDVASVNGQTGIVTLSAEDVGAATEAQGTLADTAVQPAALSAKQDTITGAASTITSSNLTSQRALISDGSGKVGVALTSAAELNYLQGVTSAIQTQLNTKAATSSLGSLALITPTGTANDTVVLRGNNTWSQVTQSMIATGAIGNAQVNNLAGIALSKLGNLTAPTVTNSAIATNDTLMVALGKLQGQLNASGQLAITSTEITALDIDGTVSANRWKDSAVAVTFTLSNIIDGQNYNILVRNTGATEINVTITGVTFKGQDISNSIPSGGNALISLISINTTVCAAIAI